MGARTTGVHRANRLRPGVGGQEAESLGQMPSDRDLGRGVVGIAVVGEGLLHSEILRVWAQGLGYCKTVVKISEGLEFGMLADRLVQDVALREEARGQCVVLAEIPTADSAWARISATPEARALVADVSCFE